MKKKILSLVLALSLFSVVLVGCSGGGAAKNYSAESITKMKGLTQKAKMYVSGNKFRIESTAYGRKSIMIINNDNKTAFILMPQQKMYMEQKLDPKQMMGKVDKFPGELKREKLGQETLNGFVCNKYKITYQPEKSAKATSVYQWISNDQLPIKSAAIDGSWSSQLKNVKKGDQPASLFKIPAGYKKFKMPDMPF